MLYYLQLHYQDEIVPYYDKPYASFDEACDAAKEASKDNICWGTVEVIAGEKGQTPTVLARYVSGLCKYTYLDQKTVVQESLAQQMLEIAEKNCVGHNDVDWYYNNILKEIEKSAQLGHYSITYHLACKYKTLQNISSRLTGEGFNVSSTSPDQYWRDSRLYINWKVTA